MLFRSNGLAGALRGRQVGRVVVSPLAAPPEGARLVAETLAARGSPPETVSRGAAFTVADVRIDVLAPSRLLEAVESPANDDCVAVVITKPVSWRAAPIRILAPCDLEYAGQEALLGANPNLPGGFDVAVVPHHGSGKQLEAFALWASPGIAVIPVGKANDYGHPTTAAVQMWGNHGRTQLARTDLDGDIAIRLCGRRLCAH